LPERGGLLLVEGDSPCLGPECLRRLPCQVASLSGSLTVKPERESEQPSLSGSFGDAHTVRRLLGLLESRCRSLARLAMPVA